MKSNEMLFTGGYVGKVIYENQHSGARRIELPSDMLRVIVEFKTQVMNEDFKVTDIRGFKANDDKFSFQCGGGYNILDIELLNGKGKNQDLIFESFLQYKNEQTYDNWKHLNDNIEEFNERVGTNIQYKGYHNEFEHYKKEQMLEADFADSQRQFVKKFVNNLENIEMNVDLSDYLKSDDYKNFVEKHSKESAKYYLGARESYGEGLSNEELVEKYKLKDKLPAFKVIIEDGMAFASDDGGMGYGDKHENMITADWDNLEKIAVDIIGQEKWDNMDRYNIKEWEKMNNTDFIQLVYDSTDKSGKYLTKEYDGYKDYSEEVVKEALTKEYSKKADEVTRELEKSIKVREKVAVKGYSLEYVEEKDMNNLQEKYYDKAKNIEEKLNPKTDNIYKELETGTKEQELEK